MFATPQERMSLRTQDFTLDFVVQFEKAGRQSELTADSVDHALALQASWIDNGADYVEIFRVREDGSLKPTIGAYRKGVA